MSSLEPFNIDLKAVGAEPATFSLRVDDAFFEAVGAPDVRKGDASVELTVRRMAGGLFDLAFAIRGEVTVPCDRCLDDMRQPIDTEGHITARLGDGYSDDGDTVTVSEDEGVIGVAWFVYEFIALDIPIRHVHAPGGCNSAMTALLGGHAAGRDGDGGGAQAVDPRWSGLEKLKNK